MLFSIIMGDNMKFHIGRKYIWLALFILGLCGCSTIKVTDKETMSSILFRNIVTNSEQISDAYLSGMLRITGVPEIPAGAYISYTFHGNVKDQVGKFSLAIFKKPVFEIYFDKKDFVLVNCRKKIYVKSNLDDIDYSKFIGVNINPLDIAYFLMGTVPYSPDLQLLNYEVTKDSHLLEISSSVSSYNVRLNADEEIISADINNQYFDSIIMDSVKYAPNSEGVRVPQSAVFRTEDKKKSISFIVDKMTTKEPYNIENMEKEITEGEYTLIENMTDFSFKF